MNLKEKFSNHLWRAAFARADDNPVSTLLEKAKQIHADDIAANRKMGQLGAELVAHATGILTHCNTDSLATGGYGTALGVIRSAVAQLLRDCYAGQSGVDAWNPVFDVTPAALIDAIVTEQDVVLNPTPYNMKQVQK